MTITRQLRTKSALAAVLAVFCLHVEAKDFVWYDQQTQTTFTVSKKTDPVVGVAIDMWRQDIGMVTGNTPALGGERSLLRFVQLDKDKSQTAALRRQGFPVDRLLTAHDAFAIRVAGGQIVVVGSNGRGTAYGILELSRMAGVSPWVWWGDVVPERRTRLAIDDGYQTYQQPSVDFRGIFINDEDWSLRNWASQTFEPDKRKGFMGPRTYKAVFQLLLRLRANTIWPAMHEGTTGFFTVDGNRQTADSCGILIGSSHCEPLLRNNVAEWDRALRGPYNYITNREQVRSYWAERLSEVKGSEELFTIGMRGIHDGSMEGVKTPEEKLNGLQQVIDDQRELIRKYYRKDVERVPQVFIPYKEVLEIMESGLRVPDDVTLMWCDDNYGYMTRLSDDAQQRRSGGGGVYYHLSYWGRPHDHLWLTTTQPGLIFSEMRAAYDHNCRRLWIANVHDPKVAAYDLEFFLDMAWNIDRISPTPVPEGDGGGKTITIEQHLQQWLVTQFGETVGRELFPAMKDYYRLCAVRKPEFMGWTQVELDKRKYPGGKSVVGQVGMTRGEAADLLEAFGRIKAVVDKCRLLVRPELSDAYYAAIVYPVYAAAAMTRKIVSDSTDSREAFDEIQLLTRRYNQLNGGKWNGLMDAAPRRLPVFDNVCGTLNDDEPFCGIACNAADYDAATKGCRQIQMLGHSMQAVSIPKGGEVVYQFDVDRDGDAVLYTAMIPTQPNDKGDLRYDVQIDNEPAVTISLKEKYRSESWKLNVLRGQALKQTPIKLGKGHHSLRVKAIDDHVIMDQWMIDFTPGRKFYVLPVR